MLILSLVYAWDEVSYQLQFYMVQALSSYVFIAANVILHSKESSLQMKHLKGLFPSIIPLLTSHHHSLRGFTQVELLFLMVFLAYVLWSD